MYNITQRKKREFEKFDGVEGIIKVLKEDFHNKKLHIRYTVDRYEIEINEFFEDNTVMVVTDSTYELDENNVISIYGLSVKYIEIDLEVLEVRGPGYFHCKIIGCRRAEKGRKDLRFKLDPDEVTSTNFKISQHNIDVSGYKIPTSIKVVLEQFQQSHSKMSDIVKVDVFNIDDRDIILGEMKKTGRSLLISNVSDPQSYKPLNDDFIDLKDLAGVDFKQYMKKYQERGYKSVLFVPIIYITPSESTVPFAYINLISKGEELGLDRVLELKDHSFRLVDRIRDANSQLIQVHQQIVDISRGGIKLKITDKNLMQAMTKARGFIFDIVFRLQAPITIYGEIKSTYSSEDGFLYVGVDFEGNSSRKEEMKRFYDILKPMESAYKNKLIKSLKIKNKMDQ
ncbi:DUF1577 domain-containing protein [Spirochaetota bacterium]